ncbi:unnamed protein product [Closterium sp. Naga37s-1]|nr:unnamed protein product [Closterium sp. Naga37s-1]
MAAIPAGSSVASCCSTNEKEAQAGSSGVKNDPKDGPAAGGGGGSSSGSVVWGHVEELANEVAELKRRLQEEEEEGRRLRNEVKHLRSSNHDLKIIPPRSPRAADPVTPALLAQSIRASFIEPAADSPCPDGGNGGGGGGGAGGANLRRSVSLGRAEGVSAYARHMAAAYTANNGEGEGTGAKASGGGNPVWVSGEQWVHTLSSPRHSINASEFGVLQLGDEEDGLRRSSGTPLSLLLSLSRPLSGPLPNHLQSGRGSSIAARSANDGAAGNSPVGLGVSPNAKLRAGNMIVTGLNVTDANGVAKTIKMEQLVTAEPTTPSRPPVYQGRPSLDKKRPPPIKGIPLPWDSMDGEDLKSQSGLGNSGTAEGGGGAEIAGEKSVGGRSWGSGRSWGRVGSVGGREGEEVEGEEGKAEESGGESGEGSMEANASDDDEGRRDGKKDNNEKHERQAGKKGSEEGGDGEIEQLMALVEAREKRETGARRYTAASPSACAAKTAGTASGDKTKTSVAAAAAAGAAGALARASSAGSRGKAAGATRGRSGSPVLRRSSSSGAGFGSSSGTNRAAASPRAASPRAASPGGNSSRGTVPRTTSFRASSPRAASPSGGNSVTRGRLSRSVSDKHRAGVGGTLDRNERIGVLGTPRSPQTARQTSTSPMSRRPLDFPSGSPGSSGTALRGRAGSNKSAGSGLESPAAGVAANEDVTRGKKHSEAEEEEEKQQQDGERAEEEGCAERGEKTEEQPKQGKEEEEEEECEAPAAEKGEEGEEEKGEEGEGEEGEGEVDDTFTELRDDDGPSVPLARQRSDRSAGSSSSGGGGGRRSAGTGGGGAAEGEEEENEEGNLPMRRAETVETGDNIFGDDIDEEIEMEGVKGGGGGGGALRRSASFGSSCRAAAGGGGGEGGEGGEEGADVRGSRESLCRSASLGGRRNPSATPLAAALEASRGHAAEGKGEGEGPSLQRQNVLRGKGAEEMERERRGEGMLMPYRMEQQLQQQQQQEWQAQQQRQIGNGQEKVVTDAAMVSNSSRLRRSVSADVGDAMLVTLGGACDYNGDTPNTPNTWRGGSSGGNNGAPSSSSPSKIDPIIRALNYAAVTGRLPPGMALDAISEERSSALLSSAIPSPCASVHNSLHLLPSLPSPGAPHPSHPTRSAVHNTPLQRPPSPSSARGTLRSEAGGSGKNALQMSGEMLPPPHVAMPGAAATGAAADAGSAAAGADAGGDAGATAPHSSNPTTPRLSPTRGIGSRGTPLSPLSPLSPTRPSPSSPMSPISPATTSPNPIPIRHVIQRQQHQQQLKSPRAQQQQLKSPRSQQQQQQQHRKPGQQLQVKAGQKAGQGRPSQVLVQRPGSLKSPAAAAKSTAVKQAQGQAGAQKTLGQGAVAKAQGQGALKGKEKEKGKEEGGEGEKEAGAQERLQAHMEAQMKKSPHYLQQQFYQQLKQHQLQQQALRRQKRAAAAAAASAGKSSAAAVPSTPSAAAAGQAVVGSAGARGGGSRPTTPTRNSAAGSATAGSGAGASAVSAAVGQAFFVGPSKGADGKIARQSFQQQQHHVQNSSTGNVLNSSIAGNSNQHNGPATSTTSGSSLAGSSSAAGSASRAGSVASRGGSAGAGGGLHGMNSSMGGGVGTVGMGMGGFSAVGNGGMQGSGVHVSQTNMNAATAAAIAAAAGSIVSGTGSSQSRSCSRTSSMRSEVCWVCAGGGRGGVHCESI